MIGVLHHFDDMKEIMSHIVALLKSGGFLIANEPQASNGWVQALRKFRTKIDSAYSEDQIQLMPNHMEELFKSSGLKNVRLFGQGYFSTPFAEVILKPKWIIYPASKFAIYLDKFVEKSDLKILDKVGWNLVCKGVR